MRRAGLSRLLAGGHEQECVWVPLDLHSLEGSLAGLAVVLGKEKACEVTRWAQVTQWPWASSLCHGSFGWVGAEG